MSKVQFTKLDDLLAHAKIADDQMVINVVNNFIEESVIHMAEARDWEWNDAPERLAIKEDCIANTDVTELDGSRIVNLIGVSAQSEKCITLVDDADIWMTVSYTVLADWQEGFEEQNWEVTIDCIKVFWQRNEFDLRYSEALKSRLTTNILSWLQ